MTHRGVRFNGDASVDVVPIEVSPPSHGQVSVETAYSLISAGTEQLLYRGEVPEGDILETSIGALDATVSYPLHYGYAAVGHVTETGPDVSEKWIDRRVFAFQPHVSGFTTDLSNVHHIPQGVDLPKATLLPTVETALNFLLDSAPRIGERVSVFGQGMVGLTTTTLLSQFPLEQLIAVDIDSYRCELARSFGADIALTPEEMEEHAPVDLAIEVSGNPSALENALECTGFDGRVIVGSWYGSSGSGVDLSKGFHRDRISIESSQVSTLDPADSGRWSKQRRLEVAWEWVNRLDLEALLTHELTIGEAETAYEHIDEGRDDVITVLFSYP